MTLAGDNKGKSWTIFSLSTGNNFWLITWDTENVLCLHAYVWIFQWRNAPWKWKCYAIWEDAMQYDSTCRDAKCWVECQAEARESAGEMITIFWTLTRLLEMHNTKNSVGKWPATRCSSNDEIPRLCLGRERHWKLAVGESEILVIRLSMSHGLLWHPILHRQELCRT